MRKLYLCLVIAIALSFSVVTLHTQSFASQRIDMQAIMAKRVPVLFEFGRGWCKPCKYMKPILEDMAKVYADRAIVTTVDMDANADLVRAFRIRMMPTQIFVTPDGKEFLRNEGTLERDQIMQIFAKMGLVVPQTQPAQPLAVPQPPGVQLPQQGQKSHW